MLDINGTGVGTTGYISSGDILNIELISSDEYDTTVSSVITVAGQTGTYYVSTKAESDLECTLSSDKKSQLQDMYDLLKAGYSDDEDKLLDFLYTYQSMLQDEMDLTNDCSLNYLLDLVNADIVDNGQGEPTGLHTAPNCKTYTI